MVNPKKTILIYTEDIRKGMKYMREEEDLDLIGQILMNGYGVFIHEKMRSPAHQEINLYPFTELIRNECNNTEITKQLLRNSEKLTGKQQLEAAQDLLEPYHIFLEKA